MAAPMTKSKRYALAGWIFAALLGFAGPALPQSAIGFVSLDRILREAPAAQAAQKKLEKEFSTREQELSKQAEQLKKMQENLERNSMTMSESERQKREREFNETNREFQRKQRDYIEDRRQREKEELEPVIERANRALQQVAEREKLDVVFQTGQVVWRNDRIDITDKVIKALADTRAGK